MNPDCPYCEFKDGIRVQHQCIEQKIKDIIDKTIEMYHEEWLRSEKLSEWLNDASSACGNCDLDSVGNVVRKLQAENERQVGANRVLAKRFNELKAENEVLKVKVDIYETASSQDQARILALVAALKKYGNHLSSCGCLELYEKEAECDCGLTEALSPQESMEAKKDNEK